MRDDAIDDPRARARAIVASLMEGMASSDDVLAAFEELDRLPADVVREELAPWTGAAPDFERLDDATRSAHGFAPRPLQLRTLAVVRDADVLDLGPIAEEQLRLAGKSWDGVDRAPEERLDEEIEGSFAGTLEVRVLGDAAGAASEAPLFDMLRYAGDSGIVFRAGTTSVVAWIGDGCVESPDRRVRSAIREVLASADRIEAVEHVPAPAASEAKAPVFKKKRAKKKTADAEAPAAKKTRAKKKTAAAAGKKRASAKKKTATDDG